VRRRGPRGASRASVADAGVRRGYELDHGKDAELKALARTMIAAQQREIRALRQHLTGTGTGMHDTGGPRASGHAG
jgi:hypothetical protein